MVKPSYKDNWSIPGGIVETNESPYDACLRETLEEIGINIKIKKLLAVIYQKHQELNDESIQFHFLGQSISNIQIRKIRLQKDEIEDFKFVNIKDIPKYNKYLGEKASRYLKLIKGNGKNNYFEERF